jgi:hypothetical protein
MISKLLSKLKALVSKQPDEDVKFKFPGEFSTQEEFDEHDAKVRARIIGYAAGWIERGIDPMVVAMDAAILVTQGMDLDVNDTGAVAMNLRRLISNGTAPSHVALTKAAKEHLTMFTITDMANKFIAEMHPTHESVQ